MKLLLVAFCAPTPPDIQRAVLEDLLRRLPSLPIPRDDFPVIRDDSTYIREVRPEFVSNVLVSLAQSTPGANPLVAADVAQQEWRDLLPAVNISSEVRAGRLIAVEIGEKVQLPTFQLRASSVATVGRVNTRLGALANPWGVLAWWVTPNDRLVGRSPAVAISGARKDGGEAVVAVAEAALEVIG